MAIFTKSLILNIRKLITKYVTNININSVKETFSKIVYLVAICDTFDFPLSSFDVSMCGFVTIFYLNIYY